MPNRLANSASPYLLQHADNPVDWHEWGPEAFAEAERRRVPILLSVGYAACHWCHVMAHESFEDAETAAVMNRHFVNIKVDREERPDIDRIYMDATQAMTGRGGWPMTVFLTPDGRPFFAGTYFPKDDHAGMPSFRRIMEAVADAWEHRRSDVEVQAGKLTEAISRDLPPGDSPAGRPEFEEAYRSIAAGFDPVHGGFGGAPKFPQAPTLEFLLRIAPEPWAPEAGSMLAATLRSMAAGGIHDQLGGGFARYSVDRHWLVPHFEKMLYDNALLARCYLRSWQVVGDDDLLSVATDTLDYMLTDLALPDGGLASSEDADSEGEEGTFYVWSWDEFREAAGEDAPAAAERFGVTEAGNFEGRNVLSVTASISDVAASLDMSEDAAAQSVERAIVRLRAARAERVRPARDDKVIAAWNGLALRALAEAAFVLDHDRYRGAAQRMARFVTTEMRRSDGRLLRSRRRGAGSIPGFCDDYAATVLGLIALHQADGDPEWLHLAVELTDDMVDLFAAAAGGFHGTGRDADELIARPLDIMDNPVQSGSSMAAEALLAVGHLTGRSDLLDRVDATVQAAGRLIASHPAAVGHLLAVAHTSHAGPQELAVVGDPAHPITGELLAVAASSFRPTVIMARASGDRPPVALFEGKLPSTSPRAYLCRRFACDAPTDDAVLLARQLGP